jgi:alpha-L-fucosidase
VGPKQDGTFPDESIRILKEIGKWMKVNSESIYGTGASPCARQHWGRITRKKIDNDTTRIYLHIFNWPENGKIRVPLTNKVKQCYLLADKTRKFKVVHEDKSMIVELNGKAPDKICSVVVLDISGEPTVGEDLITQTKDGEVVLPAADALIHNRGYGAHAKYEHGDKKDNIGFWNDPKSWLEWNFKVKKPGKFNLTVMTATVKAEPKLKIQIDGQNSICSTVATKNYDTYKNIDCGTVLIDKPGMHKLTIHPVKKGWHAVNLRQVRLTPVK